MRAKLWGNAFPFKSTQPENQNSVIWLFAFRMSYMHRDLMSNSACILEHLRLRQNLPFIFHRRKVEREVDLMTQSTVLYWRLLKPELHERCQARQEYAHVFPSPRREKKPIDKKTGLVSSSERKTCLFRTSSRQDVGAGGDQQDLTGNPMITEPSAAWA